MSALEELIDTPGPDPIEAAEQLGALLDLPSVGLKVTTVKMFGQGAGASLDIFLSNGETMLFASIRDMVRPQALIAETVACAGTTPQLKQSQAVQAVRLARIIAERSRVNSEDEDAITWGVEYLQQAETIDVDLGDQASRFRAFELVAHRDPWALARERGLPYPNGTLVLRDRTGDRLVRKEWFMRHMRGIDSRATPSTLGARMQRVGWKQRGGQGRIKATAPGRQAELTWAFWVVPAGWGDDSE